MARGKVQKEFVHYYGVNFKKVTRKCLNCDKKFLSATKFNKICVICSTSKLFKDNGGEEYSIPA